MHGKRMSLALIVALAAASGLSAAPLRSAGPAGNAIGLFLGQPTGISYRRSLGSDQSFEAKAAWDLTQTGNGTMILVQANWLLEFPGVFKVDKADFPLYFGAGLQANLGSSSTLGFRIPLGAFYRFSKAPIELCLELGPGMRLFPSTSFVGDGGLGLRFRF
jgi:hypothetical protein